MAEEVNKSVDSNSEIVGPEKPKVSKTTNFFLKQISKFSDFLIAFLKDRQKRVKQSLSYPRIITEIRKINDRIESTPHLNFISLLNAYKRVVDVLDGSIGYFYRKRNAIWFKKFFPEEELYELVKKDIELYHEKYPRVKLTITKNGIMVYDNYKKNKFNVLLMTTHGGTWVPEEGLSLMAVSKERILQEDDIGTGLIYGPLVLEKGGIWINTKFSRFFCDLNRERARAIYNNTSEKRVKNIWKADLTKKQKTKILKNYDYFYYLLNRLIENYRFNMVFDGHSMANEKGRPDFSFGVKCIPLFYMPIVERIRNKLHDHTGKKVDFNNPYKAGYILEYLSNKYRNIFVFSMEINKKLYMGRKSLKINKNKLKKTSKAIKQMFEFEEIGKVV